MRVPFWAQSLACVCSVVAVIVYLVYPAHFVNLCDEDGAVENLTALCFFAAGIAFLFHMRSSSFRPVCSLALGVMCIMAAGEEISWGQRLLGIRTPDSLRAINVQHETNLHNLAWLQGHYRLFMLIFLLAFCLLFPATVRYSRRLRHYNAWWRFPIFPLNAMPAILLGIAFMAVPRLLHIENFRDLDEVGELLVSFGFLVYAITPGLAGLEVTSPAPQPQ